MKELSIFLVFTFWFASVSVFAQAQPKPSPKAAVKNECKKGGSCCSGNAKTAKVAPKESVKKN